MEKENDFKSKTKNLFSGKELTEKQQNNSNKNMEEWKQVRQFWSRIPEGWYLN